MKLIQKFFKIFVPRTALTTEPQEFLNFWEFFVHELGLISKQPLTI